MGLVVRLCFLPATLLLVLCVDTLDIVVSVAATRPIILDQLVGEKIVTRFLEVFKRVAQF